MCHSNNWKKTFWLSSRTRRSSILLILEYNCLALFAFDVDRRRVTKGVCWKMLLDPEKGRNQKTWRAFNCIWRNISPIHVHHRIGQILQTGFIISWRRMKHFLRSVDAQFSTFPHAMRWLRSRRPQFETTKRIAQSVTWTEHCFFRTKDGAWLHEYPCWTRASRNDVKLEP